MAERRAERTNKKQLGQFMTPLPLARRVVADLPLTTQSRVLEPGFGEGSFVIALIERFLELYGDSVEDPFQQILLNNVHGVEKDPVLFIRALDEIKSRFGTFYTHNFEIGDYFKAPYLNESFDIICGNPPYGGTFDPDIEDDLDRKYGMWGGHKLKKETYSFFIAHSLELLKNDGTLAFITSDTFMTIKTMGGLRRRLLDQTASSVQRLAEFSDETKQPVLILVATKSGPSDSVSIDGEQLDRVLMDRTGNFSWQLTGEYMKYFTGRTVGDHIVATGGLVIGNNELFVREIHNGQIVEHLDFQFFDDPITLERELERARLNKLGPAKRREIESQESLGVTKRNVKFVELKQPKIIDIPNDDYAYYNKADGGIVYVPPKHVVYWKDDGDAVITFKRNGNWYLHGVGGQKFYGRQGMTWQLIAPRINLRFLPEGYVIDSGAPSAFLREGQKEEEFWFLFAWCLTDLASLIMKEVLNHTRNIQGKDLERLPYPVWVSTSDKELAIGLIQQCVEEARSGRVFKRADSEFIQLNELFAFND